MPNLATSFEPPPARFNMTEYAIGRAAARVPDKAALIVVDEVGGAPAEVWTFAELERAVLAIATGLRRLGLVRGDRVEREGGEPGERGPEADGPGDVRRAGLELGRQVGPRRARERHGADHVAAALPRGHRLEQRALAVQRADARGAEDLVPAERVEVGV